MLSSAMLALWAAVHLVAALAAQAAPPGPALAHSSSSTARPAAAVTPLLTLNQNVNALAAPHPGARVVAVVPARTYYTASPTTLPVIRTAGAGQWLRVRLPMRPDESTAWIPADAGSTGSTPWAIIIHRAQRRAVVFNDGKQRASFKVIVGTPSTPTPTGRFFVIEKLHLAPGIPEGPWALATSAYSDALPGFNGGDGEVALHGTTGLPGQLGIFASHGCVRFSPAAITWVANHVDPGTPVIVTA